MKTLRVNTSNASYEELRRTAERCGFYISQRKRHCRVETKERRWVTNIPRHNKVKKPTAKGIVDRFNLFGGNVEIS